jgi:hypothetical protein
MAVSRVFLVAALGVVATALAGCGDPTSPEDEVRAVISAAEQAAEARSVGDLLALAAPGFSDGDGRSIDELARYVRGYFIANQSVRLLTRITRIEVPAPDVAEAEVTVAMVGKDAEATAAWDLAFDIVDFDIDLRRIDGDWKVVHADWRRGGPL